MASNQVVLGTSSEHVSIPSTSASTSISTGALIVAGGVGIGGSLYVNGGVYSGGVLLGGAGSGGQVMSSLSVTYDATVGGTLAVSSARISMGSTSPYQSLSVGYVGSLQTLTTGQNNVCCGLFNMTSITTGSFNTAFGPRALQEITTGSNNVALGQGALAANLSGSFNVAVGQSALSFLTSNNNNTAIGAYTLASSTFAGNDCTAIGCSSIRFCTTGGYNTVVGASGGGNVATSSYNTLIGGNANIDSDSYSYCTALGYGAKAMASNQVVLGTSSEHVSIPSTSASTSISTGALIVAGGVGIGGSLYVNGYLNVSSMIVQTLSTQNLSFGGSTNFRLFSGILYNISHPQFTPGSDNTCIGYSNMVYLTTGCRNTAISTNALKSLSSGDYNICIGFNGGGNVVSSSNNTLIGCSADIGSDDYSQCTVLGYGATATASNQVVLGTSTEEVSIPGKLTLRNSHPIIGIDAGVYQTSWEAWGTNHTVYFNGSFDSTPVVTITPRIYRNEINAIVALVTYTDKTYFSYWLYQVGGTPYTGPVSINWIAISPQ